MKVAPPIRTRKRTPINSQPTSAPADRLIGSGSGGRKTGRWTGRTGDGCRDVRLVVALLVVAHRAGDRRRRRNQVLRCGVVVGRLVDSHGGKEDALYAALLAFLLQAVVVPELDALRVDDVTTIAALQPISLLPSAT